MREIEFRGKTYDGQWVYGNLLINKEGCFIVEDSETYNHSGEETDLYGVVWYKVIPESVGQYTGLTDINEKKIYDGDIILAEEYDEKEYYVVKFGEYTQDGSGGKYRGSKCIGFYAEWIEREVNEDYEFCYASEIYKKTRTLYDFDNIKVV